MEKKMTFRQEDLEILPTQELNKLLREELDRDIPEKEKVLLLLSILEDRDPTDSSNRIEGAREEWEQKLNCSKTQEIDLSKQKRKWIRPAVVAAAIALVLLMAIPEAVGAESVFGIIGRWTREIFSFFDPIESKIAPGEYVFQTEHEGLQQIYDAVVAQGVKEPVIPTWIPDGYTLEELRTFQQPISTKIYARLKSDEDIIQITVEIYDSKTTNTYPKDDDIKDKIEHNGIVHYIVSNQGTQQIMWNTGNIECAITSSSANEYLYQIVESIYRRVII